MSFFGKPNQSAVIAKDEVLIKDKNGNVLLSGNAEFCLDFLPKPEIHVYVTNKKELTNSEKSGLFTIYDIFHSTDLFELVLKNSENQFEAYLINYDLFNPSGPSLTFTPSSEPIIGIGNDETQMQYIDFHLFNFRKIRANKGKYCKDVHLEADNWMVEIESAAESENNFEILKKEGGYGLTHTSRLQKKDNTLISGKEATEMLGMLQYFFSFANGAWCNPMCAVGFNYSDQVWESWSSPRGSVYSQTESWFDEFHSEQLEILFPGFMRLWTDEYWSGTFQQAIYWYLYASNSNMEAGVILTQIVLENLSLDYVINECKTINGEVFSRKYAFDKFKFFFDSLCIPDCITDDTPNLKKLVEEFKLKECRWKDASYAIVRVRNSLVHPDKKNRGQFEDVMFDTWNLGLWYLELSLLWLCGYSGTYCNRLTAKCVGEVEEVPYVLKK